MRQRTDDSVRWYHNVMGAALLLLLLCSPGTNAVDYDIDKLKATLTGEPITISWCHSTGQDTDEWTHTVQVLEFPPTPNQVPSASFQTVGAGTSWNYTPAKAGLYYIRAQSCHPVDGCSPWGLSVLQDTIPGCTTDPTQIVWYFKLAPPTGGTIE